MKTATKLQKNGQITIYKEVRDSLNIKAGDWFEIEVNDKQEIILRKKPGEVRNYYCCAYKDKQGASIILSFDTEQEARDKAKKLVIKGIHGTLEKRCEIREDGLDIEERLGAECGWQHVAGGEWHPMMGCGGWGTGEIMYEKKIDCF